MTQEDWLDYVLAARARYEKLASKKLTPRVIERQARDREKGCTLSKSTVHSALRGDSWPTALTAYWVGIGICDQSLGKQLRNAWLAADGNLRKAIHQDQMREVVALRENPHLREARRERRQKEREHRREQSRAKRMRAWVFTAAVATLLATLIQILFAKVL